MPLHRWIFSLFLLGFATSVQACPPGYVPWQGIGVTGCAPTGSAGESGGALQPADPGPQWQTRWGAIAIGNGGGFGAAGDLISKRQAEKSAIRQCKVRAKSANSCKVFSYYNQCAVVAWGATNYTVQGAANVDRATQLAMNDCSKRTSDCQIFYTNCSYPQPVR